MTGARIGIPPPTPPTRCGYHRGMCRPKHPQSAPSQDAAHPVATDPRSRLRTRSAMPAANNPAHLDHRPRWRAAPVVSGIVPKGLRSRTLVRGTRPRLNSRRPIYGTLVRSRRVVTHNMWYHAPAVYPQALREAAVSLTWAWPRKSRFGAHRGERPRTWRPKYGTNPGQVACLLQGQHVRP